jgi:hypothetical protein
MATKEEVAALKNRIEELNAEVLNVPTEVEILKDGLSELVADFLHRVVPRSDLGLSVADIELPATVEGQLELSLADNDSADPEAGKESGHGDNVLVHKGPAKLSSGNGNEPGIEFGL